jgi:hypothetical protein
MIVCLMGGEVLCLNRRGIYFGTGERGEDRGMTGANSSSASKLPSLTSCYVVDTADLRSYIYFSLGRDLTGDDDLMMRDR